MRTRHALARVPQRLSRRHQRYLYFSGMLLLLSGIGWLTGHYLLRPQGALGAGPHPSEAWWMRLHGASVIGFLVVFGALLPAHVVHNWRLRVNRYSGLAVVVVVGLLAASGYGLYYLFDDRQRALTSVLHWVTGLVASLTLVLHVVLGKRLAARARERRTAARSHRARPGMARSPQPAVSGDEIPAKSL
jgi:cation transport ATPase